MHSIYNLAKCYRIKIPSNLKYGQPAYEPARSIFIGTKHHAEERHDDCFSQIKALSETRFTAVSAEERHDDCFSQIKALSETRFTAVSHVIMELDGIVLDTVPFYSDAHMKYLAKYKKRYTDNLKLNSIGLRDVDSAKYLIKELALPMTPPVYAHGVWQDLRMYFPKSKMVEGAMDLICHFYNNKIPVALTTSSNAHSFKLKMKHHKSILKFFCHIVLGDDPEVEHGKPAADIYKVAAKRFSNKPSDLTKFLVIEKSVVGVQAAKAAGMQTVLIKDKSLPRRLLEGKTELILDDLKKLDLRDFDLPRLEK